MLETKCNKCKESIYHQIKTNKLRCKCGNIIMLTEKNTKQMKICAECQSSFVPKLPYDQLCSYCRTHGTPHNTDKRRLTKHVPSYEGMVRK